MRTTKFVLSSIVLIILAACGGGDNQSEVVQEQDSVLIGRPFNGRHMRTERARHGDAPAIRPITPEVAAAVIDPPIPADANINGAWSAVHQWPLIPLHLAIMPDGRLISYGTDGNGVQTGKTIYDVWDPVGGLDGGHLTIPKSTFADFFCSATIVLPSTSNVLIAGGDNWNGTSTTNTGNNSSSTFSTSTNSLTKGNVMKRPRWYATTTTLLNGETYIQGGLGGEDRPEVRQVDGTFRLLSNVNTTALDWYYPRNYVMNDGRIFGYDSVGNMYYITTAGTGKLSIISQFDQTLGGDDSSSVMYSPGKILQFAGKSVVIDIRGKAPVLTPSGSLSSDRRLVNGTVLPNGKVLATGGSAVYNELTNINNTAEIWDPSTGKWTLGATGAIARLYHSVAILLPDASVLVGGGGAPGPLNNLNFEIYYPSYLFGANGVKAARPVINTAPTVTNIGETFKLNVTGGSSRVVLIKSGAVTHSFNMEQRFNELSFTRVGNDLTVQTPTVAGDAPPGFYMVFVLDNAGVPSIAKIIRINIPGTTAVLPTAPTGLYGYSCGDGCWTTDHGSHLIWTQSGSAGITQNVIYRGTSANNLTALTTIPAGTLYTDGTAFLGTTYYYAVSAVTSAGIGPQSNVTSVPGSISTGVTVQPPTNVTGYGCGASCWTTAHGNHVNWTQSSTSGITSNIIQRGTAEAGPFTTIVTISANTGYIDTGVTIGSTYYYVIKAVTSSGTSVASNVTAVTAE